MVRPPEPRSPGSPFPGEGAFLGPGPLWVVSEPGKPRVAGPKPVDAVTWRKVRKWGSLGQRRIPRCTGGGTVAGYSGDWQPFADESQAALQSPLELGVRAGTDTWDPPPGPGTAGPPLLGGTGRAEPPHLPPTHQPPAGAARLPEERPASFISSVFPALTPPPGVPASPRAAAALSPGRRRLEAAMTQAFARSRLGSSPEHGGACLERSFFSELSNREGGRFCPCVTSDNDFSLPQCPHLPSGWL